MSNDNKKPWYYARTAEEVKIVNDMFWEFHDFRVQRIEYIPEHEEIDLYLEYDSDGIRILLKFIGNVSMNFVSTKEYETDWLGGVTMGLNSRKQVVWAADESLDVMNLPQYPLWIVGDRFRYALIDGNNNPVEIPNNILHQTIKGYDYNKNEYIQENYNYEPKKI